MENYYWKDDNTIVIAEREFAVQKSGAEYARQFGRLSGWLGTHAITGLAQAQSIGILNEGNDEAAGLQLFAYLLSEGITPEAMVELASILLGSTYEFAEENFDPGWLIEVALVVIEAPGIRRAFQSIWERFFLVATSDQENEEDQAQDKE